MNTTTHIDRTVITEAQSTDALYERALQNEEADV